MKDKLAKTGYILSTALFAILGVLFFFVAVKAFFDLIAMSRSDAFLKWNGMGNYLGIFLGIAAYAVFLITLIIPRIRHNLTWFMKFTHELTHTLVAVCFFAKIREFVVKDRECYVSYKSGPLGYIPVTLSPYCIPIYTFMLFPFRFAGESKYMVVFDFLIAFTYAFHIHSFIRQTRFDQSDIVNCGKARSFAFITFVHFIVLALVLATPRGGVMNALHRVFWEYPSDILFTLTNL